jgi:uncharacterized protein (DUF1919 family)
MKVVHKIKETTKALLAKYAKKRFYFDCQSFPSIISNDCFGGEIYRSLDLEYNTPFIGLMIMAPCYIRLLKNLEFYLSKNLEFKKESKYPHINDLLSKKGYFPIASLNNEIEIQFLHYYSEKEARDKWERRKKRIDFKNLFIKFDYSKDYADKELLEEFLKLRFEKKIALGSASSDYGRNHKNIIGLSEYSNDGVVFFRLSLKYIDYKHLFTHNVLRKPTLINAFLLTRFLSNS